MSMLFVLCRHTEPSSGASTPDLDPYSPVDRKKVLKGCTFVPDIQEIRVRSDFTNPLGYFSFVLVNCKRYYFHCSNNYWTKISLKVYFLSYAAPLCQRRATCTSWSPTQAAGWSAMWWCAGRTSTCTAARGTVLRELSSTSPLQRWSTAKTNRLYCGYDKINFGLKRI